MASDPVQKKVGWLEWVGWKSQASTSAATSSQPPAPEVSAVAPTSSETLKASVKEPETFPEEVVGGGGWDRVKHIYEYNSMEKDVAERVVRMSFFGGFLVGGATGYAQARHTYEVNNVGRKYLSPSDAVKRNIDYAIVRFAKGGFGVGIKCAIISGSIVFSATHLAAYRDKFSSWYFPAISVGGIFTFPLGVLGSMKAVGLGVSSGLTLSAVVHLYAMSIDKSVDEAYRIFKRDYEKELKTASEWDQRVSKLMEEENIKWRQTAVKRLKEIDHEKLSAQDDF